MNQLEMDYLSEEQINFSQDTLELAFQLISDASVGRITNFERTVNCLKYYHLYLSRFYRLIRLIIHLTLVILLIYDASFTNTKSITLSNITVPIELTCLSFYFIQLVIVYKFSIKSKFFKDKKHYCTLITLLVSIIDIILFTSGVYRFRISPALRVLLFINSTEQSQIRRHLRTLRITIINVVVIIPFLLTFYFMMVAFIYRYFNINKSESVFYYNGKPYMQNFLDIVWETLVFVTSANSPDVILPGFAKSALIGILFLIFYATFYFLLIFVYGLIMGNFRDHAKEEMRKLLIGKFSLMYDAFLLLEEKLIENNDNMKGNQTSNIKNVITKKKWELLIKKFKKYKNSIEARNIIYSLLSNSNKLYLTKNEFMQMDDLMSIPLSMVSDKLHFFEKYFWFCLSNKLADFVENKYFSLIVGIVIVINSIIITFTNEPYSELFFSILFLLEIVLRIYVKGFLRYFHSLWNIFDFTIVVLALVFWFIENTKLNVQTITFTLLVLRNLRLLKLLRGVAAYHQLLHILGMLIPTICSLITIVFCFTVFYVCIGIWSYDNLFFENHNQSDYLFNSTNCNITELTDSDFGRQHYCILSFNSFISGFLTLCSVSIGNNWHTISEGYELGSKHVLPSRLYFTIFKGVITYLLLLIVAFVLDVFLLAYNQKNSLKIEEIVKNKLQDLKLNFISYGNIRESRIIKRNSNDSLESFSILRYFKRIEFEETNRIWFRLKAKGARSVEYVSQAMFQEEIETDLKNSKLYEHYFEYE